MQMETNPSERKQGRKGCNSGTILVSGSVTAGAEKLKVVFRRLIRELLPGQQRLVLGKSSSNSRLKAGMLPRSPLRPSPCCSEVGRKSVEIVNPFMGLYIRARTVDQLKCPG